MSFASDQLYNGYLRRKRWTIVNKVKASEIIHLLPCLTEHDKENIEARTQTKGNLEGMGVLLDCLKRRDDWASQFINALRECEHLIIAAEMEAEYDSLRGIRNSPPIRARDPPAPSVRHLSASENRANTEAAVPPPDAASPPQEPAAPDSPPLETPVQPEAPQSSAAPVPEAVPPPEPVAEPPQSPQAARPSTPPPTPEILHTQAITTPPPQREVGLHQEPVENSESDTQRICGDDGVIDGPMRATNTARSMDYVVTPQQSPPVKQNKTGTTSQLDPVQTKTTTDVRPPQSPSPTQINSDVTEESFFPALTLTGPPVQDTSPPGIIKAAALLKPGVTTQVVGRSPPRETAAPPPPACGAGMDASLSDDDGFLSKPGELMSVRPPDDGSPPTAEPSSPVQLYSGDSGRLEMSDAAPRTVVSARVPLRSTSVTTASGLPCQESGVSFKYNQPEENYYEPPSPSLSLDMQEVYENVGHVSEEPSIQNLDSQGGTPQAQINGEGSKVIPSEAERETRPAQESEEETSFFTTNKYFLAAGVGAFALLVAWRFKN